MTRPILSLILLLWLVTYGSAFDFGFSPKLYRKGDKVELLVNKVESDQTQLPYAYYDLKFVCPPSKDKKPMHLSLGEVLRGDRFWQSDYNLVFGVDLPCSRLCDFNAREPQLRFADQLIRNGYVAKWLVDGLPGATTFVSRNKNKYYAAGFPLGFHEDGVSYLYNHMMLVIRYHREKGQPGLHSIVGFEVYPKSVEDETCPGSSKEYNNLPITLKKDATGVVPKQRLPFTYSVYWREDNSIDYRGRWDLYYANEQTRSGKIHVFALINSFVLLFLITMVVVVIYYKAIRNSEVLPLSDPEPKSWKSLSQDVMKRPNQPFLLSILVSSGLQLIMATLAMITFVIMNNQFGFTLEKGYTGGAFSLAITSFFLSGIVPSFIGIVAYKLFNNIPLNNKFPTSTYVILSAIFAGFLPGLILTTALFLNFFVWAKESSDAIPFSTILIILVMFLFVTLPLGLIGGYFGNKVQLPRKSFLSSSGGDSSKENFKAKSPSIKNSSNWVSNTAMFMILYGLIPFCIVYVELSFIFNSVWLEKTSVYYMYGFLLLTTIILMIIIAESSVIGIFINLSVNVNPNWHWLAFRIGSSIGLYIFFYSMYYFIIYLNVGDLVSSLLYFGYMGLICVLISIACGSMAVAAGLVFINLAYSNVKRD